MIGPISKEIREMFDDIKNGIIKLSCICLSVFLLVSLVACGNSSDSSFERASVVRVIDGDTIHVMVSGKKYKLRMIGVDTPETVHPSKPVQFYGKEASDYTKKQLKDRTVYLQKDLSDTDKYGRLLRYVWLEKPSSDNPSQEEISKYMYNAQLIINGYAYSYSYQPDTRYSQLFARLQHQAQENSVGLWDEDKLKAFNQTHPDSIDTRPLNGGKSIKDSNKNLTRKDAKKTYYPSENKSINKDKLTDKTKSKESDQDSQKYIKANKKSKVYHLRGSKGYDSVSDKNAVYFDNEDDAIAAGYRKSKR